MWQHFETLGLSGCLMDMLECSGQAFQVPDAQQWLHEELSRPSTQKHQQSLLLEWSSRECKRLYELVQLLSEFQYQHCLWASGHAQVEGSHH